jgi:hypothetical protein
MALFRWEIRNDDATEIHSTELMFSETDFTRVMEYLKLAYQAKPSPNDPAPPAIDNAQAWAAYVTATTHELVIDAFNEHQKQLAVDAALAAPPIEYPPMPANKLKR